MLNQFPPPAACSRRLDFLCPIARNALIMLPLALDGQTALPGRCSLPVLFAVTLFVSAVLLFLVQPMIAKMILPKFGGTPAVWNTCMVFFQAALLAGYAYAHATTDRLGSRRQSLLHLLLIFLPFLVLPIAVGSGGPHADAHP